MKPWEEFQVAKAAPSTTPVTEPAAEPGPWAAYAGEAPVEPAPEPGPDIGTRIREAAGDFRTGLAGSAIKTFLGVRQLIGLEGEHDEAIRQMIAQDVKDAGGWATAGAITGDIAQMAAPGSAALRLARAANAAVKGSRVARALPGATEALTSPLAAGVATAAGYGALQPVSEGQSRVGRAASEGAWALGGGYLGGKLLEGVRKTDAAKALLQEGAYLTPGMAAESKFLQSLESVMEVTPLLARGTKAARERAQQEWNVTALNAAKPPGAEAITEMGAKGVAQLKKAFKRAYETAWGRAVNPGGKSRIAEFAQSQMDTLTADAQRRLRRVFDNIEGLTKPASIDRVLRKLQSSRAARDDLDLLSVVQSMRQIYRETLGGGVQKALAAVDEMYPAYLAVRRAAKNAAKESGVFTPAQLAQGAAVKGGEDLAARGQAAMLPEAIAGLETVGRKVGGQPLEWFRRLASISPTPLPMQIFGQRVIGEGGEQAAARAVADALRQYGVAPGVVTSAAMGE